MKKVFLGGTCNGSTWRDTLIKDLQIDYFSFH
ncbi:nucleoside 2-deoxyribosyltransferase domain-containing protein [Ginsengibacter hankyongi]|nr:nucleoside 2-deoxyribosyltransferase domain-containing protein [Ginsengibacter hankyongi]